HDMPFQTTARSEVVIFGLAAAVFSAMLMGCGSAQADEDNADLRIRRGFEIAPVPLNLAGKDRTLVGLGSYLVNAVGVCNDCHTASAQALFAAGGNPFFGQPKTVDQTIYLGGGSDFGPVVPGTPHIVSRNLTPDKTGKPAGGRSFDEFT